MPNDKDPKAERPTLARQLVVNLYSDGNMTVNYPTDDEKKEPLIDVVAAIKLLAMAVDLMTNTYAQLDQETKRGIQVVNPLSLPPGLMGGRN